MSAWEKSEAGWGAGEPRGWEGKGLHRLPLCADIWGTWGWFVTICFFLSSLHLCSWFFPPRSWTIPIPYTWGFPGGASGKESTCQFRRCKRCEFDPWVGKIPWSRKWQLAPLGQRSLAGYSLWDLIVDTAELPNTHTHTHTHTHTIYAVLQLAFSGRNMM